MILGYIIKKKKKKKKVFFINFKIYICLLKNQKVQERALKSTNDMVGDYPKTVEKLMEDIRILKVIILNDHKIFLIIM